MKYITTNDRGQLVLKCARRMTIAQLLAEILELGDTAMDTIADDFDYPQDDVYGSMAELTKLLEEKKFDLES